MYIVVIAWMYVVLMMAAAEAANPNGTLLGAIVTLILYGLLPVALVVYLMRTPSRKRAIKAKDAESAIDLEANSQDAASSHPDTPNHSPAATQKDSIAPVREVP
jgi:hypothetical protein